MTDGKISPTDGWTQTVATVRAAEGLHARPAIRLSQLARTFSAAIRLCVEGQDRWVDAKSVARLMGLRVESGRTVILRADGEDADAALAALGGLIERDFADVGGVGADGADASGADASGAGTGGNG